MWSVSQAQMDEWSREFDQIRTNQFTKGSEYETDIPGWLRNDLFKMFAEELADIANYSQLFYMKLRAFEEALIAGGIDLSDPDALTNAQYGVPPSPGTFVGQSDLQGFLPSGPGLQNSG